jgi:2-iminobutanoate/2-iminopropanoate deaminase
MSAEIRSIHSSDAPTAIGPYSQAVAFGDLVFCSGQIPLDPVTGHMVVGEFEDEARQVFANLRAVLAAAGTSLDRALKVTVYLIDMYHFPQLNQIYSEAFGDARPARSTVQVARLPRDARVEIDVIAAR